jgi:hypothetical protein
MIAVISLACAAIAYVVGRAIYRALRALNIV